MDEPPSSGPYPSRTAETSACASETLGPKEPHATRAPCGRDCAAPHERLATSRAIADQPSRALRYRGAQALTDLSMPFAIRCERSNAGAPAPRMARATPVGSVSGVG